MYQIGDNLMYGTSGVCKIIDITTRIFNKTETLYYVLQPIFDPKTKIFCPVNSNKISMRKLLSADEVRELIDNMPDLSSEWIENEQQRKEHFTSVIKSGEHKELIKLIKVIHAHKKILREQNKKLHIADEKAFHDAEKLLYEEFASVLNLELNEVVPFITGTLKK